jgi:hypothetical protein
MLTAKAEPCFHHHNLMFDPIPLLDEYCTDSEHAQRYQFKWPPSTRVDGHPLKHPTDS